MVEMTNRTNPFPGLRPFELDEEHLFFGREGQADDLLVRLNRTRFLAIVGTSGSGKSSLVRAGLLPSLYSGFLSGTSSGWRIAILRPGQAPIRNLAKALNQQDVFGVDTTDDEIIIRTALMESTLRRGALGLVEVTQESRMANHESLLVVVDQFEELFRFKQQAQSLVDENEALAFVKLLLAAVGQRAVAVFVVLTMRSDFLGDCTQFQGLPEALNDSQYLTPRLTRDQLRQAIEGPVAVGGSMITPRLVNRLLNDIGDKSDQLPILQHALMRTWDCWKEQAIPPTPIDIEHYEAIGGMSRALSIHADQIYFSFPDQESRKITETVFKRLTEKGLDNREVRRPSSLEELCLVARANQEKVISVINEFRKYGASFLMPPPDQSLEEKVIIDISQESLMRIWDRLQNWMSEEVETAQMCRRLAETTQLHLDGKAALIRDPELRLAIDWKEKIKGNSAWAERYSNNFYQIVTFIEKSAKQSSDEEAVRAKKSKTKFLQNWIIKPSLLGGVGLATTVLLSITRDRLLGAISPKYLVACAILLIVIAYAVGSIRIIKEGNAAIVERLGRYRATLAPGANFIVPFFDAIVIEDTLREQILDIPPKSCTTKDNINLEVDTVIYWRILDLEKAYYSIEDVGFAMIDLVSISIMAEIAKIDFQRILSSRESINKALLDILDKTTEPWGVKVNLVELQEIRPPKGLIDSIQQEQAAAIRRSRMQSIVEAKLPIKYNETTEPWNVKSEHISVQEPEGQSPSVVGTIQQQEVNTRVTRYSASRIGQSKTRLQQNWIRAFIALGSIGLGVTALFSRDRILEYIPPKYLVACAILLIVVGYILGSVRIVKEGNVAILERLGRYRSTLESGLNFIVPFFDVIIIEDTLREQILDISPKSCTTKDNVNLEVDAVIYWRILDLEKTYYAIEDVETAISELVSTSLRSEIGRMEFREIMPFRNSISEASLEILNIVAEVWGVRGMRIEIQEIKPPKALIDAMDERWSL
ncbi:SPFH domain-containing protein [Leptothoe sp. EHU-05/26/07-4]